MVGDCMRGRRSCGPHCSDGALHLLWEETEAGEWNRTSKSSSSSRLCYAGGLIRILVTNQNVINYNQF